MKLLKQLPTIAGILIVAFAINLFMPADTRTAPVSAQDQSTATDKYDGDCDGTETAGRCADKPFDHSLCQYPARTTNPPDGCDNSDPCDPAQTKGGSGDCVDVPQTNSPAVTTAPPSNQCGGGK